MNYKEFFKRNGDKELAEYCGGLEGEIDRFTYCDFTTEQLYQAFKARLMDELTDHIIDQVKEMLKADVGVEPIINPNSGEIISFIPTGELIDK